MSVYCTGDTHGNFQRFYTRHFPEKKQMTRDDTMIICGDFGAIWNGEPQDTKQLDWLEALPFTTTFVCGNHENFDELYRYPVEEWHGGKVHRIRPHVLHLMRGQIFEIEGYTFFTMGGARSVDVWDGILDPDEPDFERKYWALRRQQAVFRVKHLSWWEQELPSDEEYAEARRNLERVNYEVDYIITHCAPDSIQDELSGGRYLKDQLTGFLEEVKNKAQFHYWLHGHYHDNKIIGDQFVMLYEQIVQII